MVPDVTKFRHIRDIPITEPERTVEDLLQRRVDAGGDVDEQAGPRAGALFVGPTLGGPLGTSAGALRRLPGGAAWLVRKAVIKRDLRFIYW